MARAFAEIAFTDAVRTAQAVRGSADGYAKFLSAEAAPGDALGPEEAAFIAARDGFYQATVSETGWPYVQFRGGPRGFLRALDAKRIAYADFRGNRQYLSVGNLGGNPRVSLILMDYPNRRRLKVWGKATLIDRTEDPALVDSLQVEGYRAKPERAVVIGIEALDWNCPAHIPQRLTAGEMAPAVGRLNARIAELEAENAALIAARKAP